MSVILGAEKVNIDNLRVELGMEDIRLLKDKCLIVIPYRYISTVGKSKLSLFFFLNDPNMANEACFDEEDEQ